MRVNAGIPCVCCFGRGPGLGTKGSGTYSYHFLDLELIWGPRNTLSLVGDDEIWAAAL